jgi:hypothetical protein
MKMLDLDACLPDLCVALDDHSYEHRWWLDPSTGELEFHTDDTESEYEDPEERGLLLVQPTDSHEAYRDMEEFVERVVDPRARDLLARAITGRGAFRRFKDTLFEFSELREAWFRFHDVRCERRAIEWLEDEKLITPADAERARAARPEPELPAPPATMDAEEIARAVAADLRELYGERLRDVVLFGSRARGDADPESDIDLLVVLDEVTSRRRELLYADPILWRHSLANDVVVSEVPVSAADYAAAATPLLIQARTEGFSVA